MLLEMIRPLLLVPALAIAALLGSAPVAAAVAIGPQAHVASIEFGLPTNNGLHGHIETSSEGITLEIADRHHFVTYRAQGEATEAGLKVQFGDLGLIDVAFTPTKTRKEEPPKGCTGPPSTSSDGVFAGTIDFTGEREYVRIEATEVRGWLAVYRESEWKCRRHKRRMPAGFASRSTVVQRRSVSRGKTATNRKEPAALTAIDRHCACMLAAFGEHDRRGRGQSYFFGLKAEETEGMEITRVTYARAGANAFVFDHKAGTARLRPPRPFSGVGTFKRRPHSRDLWRGAIEVPLLGADPLSVRAPAYRVRLVRARPGGE